MQSNPYTLRHDEGQSVQSLGALITIKATSEQTGGLFSLFEVSYPSDYATPLHIHYVEDVAVYVLEGELTFFWGIERLEAVTGSYFYMPRFIPHGFRVSGASRARILYATFPAGFDQFICGPEVLASCSEAMKSAARYKIEILGPLPE